MSLWVGVATRRQPVFDNVQAAASRKGHGFATDCEQGTGT